MLNAYCTVSNTFIRLAANHRSGILSQLLFGEIVEIMEDKSEFFGCRFPELDIFGFIDKRHLTVLEKVPTFGAFSLESVYFTAIETGSLMIPMGAFLHEFDGIQFRLDNNYFHFGGVVLNSERSVRDVTLLLKLARKYMNTPYLLGGRSTFGIDGFGLIQQVLKYGGVQVKNDLDCFLEKGEVIHFLDTAQPCDIVYFDAINKVYPPHFGILLGEGLILHCFDCVRIDLVDHFGIYNKDLRTYTHKLRSVFRFFETLPETPVLTIPQKIKESTETVQTTLL